eukprot:GEMP01025154.1.p1 GENE.GEMP01025154.1~~GEMP01025154.1.p1  ORF type:complete len:749 (+),score=186.83 GEMP01025154.1:73-2319(+)
MAPSGGEFHGSVRALVRALGCRDQDHAEERALRILSSTWGTRRLGPQHSTLHILSLMTDLIDGETRLRFEVVRRKLANAAGDRYNDILSILLALQNTTKDVPHIPIAPFTTAPAAAPVTRMAPTPQKNIVLSEHTFYGLDEKSVLTDLIFALQGVDGHWIYADEHGSYVVDSDLCIARPARRICEEMLILATMHKKVCLYLEDEGQGLVRQALRDALQTELVPFYREIASLEIRVDSPSLTLRRLMVWAVEPLVLIRTLWDLASSTAGLEGASIISSIYALGTLQQSDIINRVLQQVMAPLLRMIDLWMSEGLLKDAYSEFFVESDVTVPLQELWTRRYRLDEARVPCHIGLRFANKIFLCGKSLNFIRLCCQETDWLDLDVPTVRECASEGTSLAALEERVNRAAQRTNERLVSLLFSKYNLLDHLSSIRRYLLLGQGDFISQLLTEVEDDLRQDASTVYKHTLLGHVDRAIRLTNAQCQNEEYLERLDVKLLKPSSGEQGWNIFILDYLISAPLHVVFTPDAMETYHRAFSFLWHMRRVLHSLGKCWTAQMALEQHQRQLRFRNCAMLLRSCEVLRHEMLHYMQNIQSYVMFEILEMAWRELEHGLKNTCTDLDQVLHLHAQYLQAVSVGCFLTSAQQPVLERIRALFDHVQTFTETYENLTGRVYEETMATEISAEAGGFRPEEGFRPPPRRLVAEFRSQIDEISSNFSSGLEKLFAQLHESGLSFLVEKLDFNEFYKSHWNETE